MSRQPSIASSVSSLLLGSFLCGGLAFAQAPGGPFGDIDLLSTFLGTAIAHLLHGDPVRCTATLSVLGGLIYGVYKYAPLAPWRREVNDTNATLAALSTRLDALELAIRHTGPPARERSRTPAPITRDAGAYIDGREGKGGMLVWSDVPTLDPATPDVDYLEISDGIDDADDAADTRPLDDETRLAPVLLAARVHGDDVLARILDNPPAFLPSSLRTPDK